MMGREELPRVPDLVLERYRLGELPEDETKALEQRLRDDAGLRGRLEDLDRSDAQIRRQYPPAWLAERIGRRLPAAATPRRPRPAWPRGWAVPAAVAAVTIVLVVLAPRLAGPPPGASSGPAATAVEPGDRVKGLRPSLVVFRKTPEGSETLADGAGTREGDVLRVGYRAAGRPFGVILSVDGRGAVTLHLPARGEQAAALKGEKTVLLDQAYELDDAPRFERFYLVTASEPFAVAPVVEAARRLGASPAPALPLAASFEQATFLLRKGGRP